MSRKIEDYVETRTGDSTTLHHPALGCIKVFRTSGHRRLNGSDFTHQHYVSIEIDTAKIERNLAQDWHYPEKNIVRFAFSEAQWAHFVSSVGMGEGTLITFDRRPTDDYRLMECPGVPYREEAEITIDEGVTAIHRAGQAIDDLSAAIDEATVAIPRKKVEALRAAIWKAQRALKDTLPFVEKSFRERMEERVIKAKTEVAAWAESFIKRTGLKALQGKGPLQLEDDRDGD